MKREWCTEDPIHLPGFGFYSSRNPEDAWTKTIKEVGKRVVCPLCKKRFKPRIRECGDVGCWHVYVPPHKKRK